METRDELTIFLSEKVVPDASIPNGPLSWWKARESDYPNLSKMARDFLAVAGTGVSFVKDITFHPNSGVAR